MLVTSLSINRPDLPCEFPNASLNLYVQGDVFTILNLRLKSVAHNHNALGNVLSG